MFNLSRSQFFVIGNPIHHSVSPQMHQAVLDDYGIDSSYGALLIQSDKDLDLFFEALRTSNVLGVNVTVPYKESVIPYMDNLDTSAKKCHAVNTIINKNGVLTGFNTDGAGLVYSLKEDVFFEFESKNVVLLGAGGAAKGIASALVDLNIKSLTILNRTVRTAELLQYHLESYAKFPINVGSLSFEQVNDEWLHLNTADIVIQTTSVGLDVSSVQSPINDFSWVSNEHTVVDIIYKPYETAFLNQCKFNGASIVNGVGMLAGQGALAFNLFTQRPSNYNLMRKIVEQLSLYDK